MKITIITGPFLSLPPYAIGAVEKLWYSIGQSLINKGIDIIFISKKPYNIDSNYTYRYIKGYERTGSWIKDFFLDFIYSFRALLQLEKSDIVILNSLWTPVLIRLFNKKVKFKIFSVERFPKKQLGIYNKIGKIDFFRCCSSSVYNEILKQNENLKNKSWIIPNFIDDNIFYLKEKRELSKDYKVVYSGRIHKEKGLDILIKALEYLYKKEKIEISLILIGPSDKERGGSGKAYINNLLSNASNIKIKCIDAIYNTEDLANEIRKGDIFCYPSVSNNGETFGVAPLEAMALGLPVVVSNLECFKDFIKDNENGLIFDHNSLNSHEDLAYKIKSIIDSKELFNTLSIEGAKTAKNFSVEEVSMQYYDKFKELLNEKGIC